MYSSIKNQIGSAGDDKMSKKDNPMNSDKRVSQDWVRFHVLKACGSLLERSVNRRGPFIIDDASLEYVANVENARIAEAG